MKNIFALQPGKPSQARRFWQVFQASGPFPTILAAALALLLCSSLALAADSKPQLQARTAVSVQPPMLLSMGAGGMMGIGSTSGERKSDARKDDRRRSEDTTHGDMQGDDMKREEMKGDGTMQVPTEDSRWQSRENPHQAPSSR